MDGQIELLPDELLVIILRFLPATDLLNVARASNRFWDIVCDRRIVGNFNLQGAYQLTTDNVKEFLLSRTRCRNITTLNANHVYWIRFHVFISKLKNLESLHILGSPLTANQLLTILLACPKLEELSISWPDDVKAGSLEEGQNTAKQLKSLAVLLSRNPLSLLHLLQYTSELTSFTVTNHHASTYFASPSSTSGCGLKVSLPHLTDFIVDNVGGHFSLCSFGTRRTPPGMKVKGLMNEVLLYREMVKTVVEGAEVDAEWRTFWVNTPLMIMKLGDIPGLSNIMFKCQQLYATLTLQIYEEMREAQLPHLHQLVVSGQAPRNLSLNSLLRKCAQLRSLHLNGLNISLDLKQLQDLFPDLEQLSVCCKQAVGTFNCFKISAIASLTRLTHLSVPACALIEMATGKDIIPRQVVAPAFGFKKQRVGYSSGQDVDNAAFNQVIDSCPLLKMLEIGIDCSSVSCSPGRIWWECLENIKKLSNLTHLTLDGIPVRNGTFFIDIAKGCNKLEFLRVRHLGSSSLCTYINHLSQALPYCQNLRHFRLEQNYLAPASNLWVGLSRCRRLERLFVLSESDGKALDLERLDFLISDLPSLVFVFVAGSHTAKSNCAALTKKYRTSSRPALVVRVRTGLWDVFDDSNAETRLVPAVHFNDMITFRSWVFNLYAQPYRGEKEKREAKKRKIAETITE